MDKFDRIYALHNLFAARRTPLKVQDIQQRLECSRPTAYRLIELLRDQLNAPVVSDKDGGGFLYGRNTSADPYDALAERLNERKLATLDQRHFRTVRPAHTDALRLWPAEFQAQPHAPPG